ncbi:MAG: RimK family alpha-L-glutamate ligase [Bacteroidota bacterium]
MNIGILSRSAELYSTQSLFQAGKRLGHQMQVIDHTRCTLVLDGEKPNVFYQSKPLHYLDAVIPRIGASVTALGAAVISQFELMDVVTPTSPQALQLARDKLRCLQLLSRRGLPVPKTIMVGRYENLHQVTVKLGRFPVVVKVLEGTHGEGVALARTFWDLQRQMNTYFRYHDRVILQEYVPEAKGADLRVIVVADQIVASMRRQAKPGEFRSNLHRGASAVPIELSKKEQKLVRDVVSCLGIEVAGVDLLPSERGALVMEVNASPGLEGIEKTTGVDVAGAIVQHVDRKYRLLNSASQTVKKEK